jgi:GNAT superfamily N-acetyltransferase
MVLPDIRRMRVSDIETVAQIYADVLEPSYISFSELAEGKAATPGKLSEDATNIFRQQLYLLIGSATHGFFVAVAGNAMIGFALASFQKTPAGHSECWIDDIGVRPELRRHGVGAALMKEVFKWGARMNCRYFLLESGIHNTSAHHLFEQMGFRPLSTVFWHSGMLESSKPT